MAPSGLAAPRPLRHSLRRICTERLERVWYGPGRAGLVLRAASRLYGAVAGQEARRARLLGGTRRTAAPVVVVGNISIGGTGKTPLLIALARALRQRGLAVGVVSRGTGGRRRGAHLVGAGDSPLEVGDEPCLIAQSTGCPVAVGRDRWRALRLLSGCQLILSDDGLQHLAMPRAMELAVVDGERGLGNGLLLPAGPLREPPQRLQSVDLVVGNGALPEGMPPGAVVMRLAVRGLVPLADWPDGAPRMPEQLPGFRGPVHAVAGIGNPQRFFATLRRLGLDPVEHPFPDHHRYRAEDLRFGRGLPMVMTAKDAIKCRHLAHPPEHCQVLEVEARMEDAPWRALLGRLAGLAGK